MKYYFLGVFDIAVIAIVVGFVVPFLISAPSTLAVILGLFILVIVLPAVLYFFNKSTIQNLFNKVKEL